MVTDSGRTAGNGGLREGGEGRGARWRTAGGGGWAMNAILMMKMVGRPGNEDNLTIN
jgi:hypothetical protein